jgi:two-component system response regulator VicR
MVGQASILVVEDDRGLAETLQYNLEREGFRTTIARTGLEAVVLARSEQPDLMLLDLMLPEMDGFEVCRAVRATSPLPIIMLTARDDEMDRVLGLEMGADDYVSKPFSLRELLARIRATLRRVELSSAPVALAEPMRYRDIELLPAARSVTRSGRAVQLLPREFDLLAYLMQHRGQVMTREQLLQNVWGLEYFGDTRTVDVHVRRLRLKLEPDPSRPAYIRTVHGVGYTFGDAGGSLDA